MLSNSQSGSTLDYQSQLIDNISSRLKGSAIKLQTKAANISHGMVFTIPKEKPKLSSPEISPISGARKFRLNQNFQPQYPTPQKPQEYGSFITTKRSSLPAASQTIKYNHSVLLRGSNTNL